MTTPKQKNPIQHVEAGRHLTALDIDGDGQITAAEWVANTDPTSGDFVFKFDQFIVANAGQKMDIRWKTETGRRYRIQQSTNLKDWHLVEPRSLDQLLTVTTEVPLRDIIAQNKNKIRFWGRHKGTA